MSARSIGLTCLHEVRRNVRSIKGLLVAFLYLLGGAGTMLAIIAARREVLHRATNTPPEVQQAMYRSAIGLLYHDDAVADWMALAPKEMFAFYQLTSLFLPILIVLVGFDQIAGDLQYRTIRYAALRATRTDLIVGRALGLWAVSGTIALCLDLFVWVATISQGVAGTGDTLVYGFRFWLASLLSTGASVALTTLVSTVTRSPVLALLGTLGGMILVSVGRGLASVDWAPAALHGLKYVSPAAFEARLVSPNIGDLLLGAGACVGYFAVLVAVAVYVMQRRDL